MSDWFKIVPEIIKDATFVCLISRIKVAANTNQNYKNFIFLELHLFLENGLGMQNMLLFSVDCLKLQKNQRYIVSI